MTCADQVELVRKLRQAAIDRCGERITAAKRLKSCEEREGPEDLAPYGIGRRLRNLRGL